MKKEKIWLSPPHMSGREVSYIQDAVSSNWVTQGGPNVDAFEKNLEKYLGNSSFVAATNSGTSAIHLALQILGVGKDDIVICQSLTFIATANPVVYLGAVPVFVDSEPDTWNICPNALEDALKFCIQKGRKPKAIIAVTLYGMPYRADEISFLSEKYGVPVLEDSAEALGSRYKGRPCGTLGDISVFSFNGNKIITTSGGGALVVKLPEQRKKAVWLSSQAKEDKPWYEHTDLGFNYRMSNISASVGLAQLEVLEDRIIRRRENHNFYRNFFKSHEGYALLKEPDDSFFSNFWLNALIIDSKQSQQKRDDLLVRFHKENIEVRPLWKPMHLQPLYSNADYFGNKVSENLFENGICLPSGSSLTNEDLERVAAVFRQT